MSDLNLSSTTPLDSPPDISTTRTNSVTLPAPRGRPSSGARFRGRGRGGHFSGALVAPSRDAPIQATDTDAAVSRLSAVEAGYLDDGFAAAFVKDEGKGVRRLPIINRGTYTRTTALDILIERFLSSRKSTTTPPRKQIISLGAGTDTRFFRLRKKGLLQNVIYHEIDFPAVCRAKEALVRQNEALFGIGGKSHFPDRNEKGVEKRTEVSGNSAADEKEAEAWGYTDSLRGEEPRTPHYIFHPLDLRHISSLSSLSSLAYLKVDIPTLLISECCLCYISVSEAADVIKWFTDRISSLGIILYEPIGPDDSFGQMMIENLSVRGILMPTVRKYKTLAAQMERLRAAGFGRREGVENVDGMEGRGITGAVVAKTVDNIWEGWITKEEKERVDRLEGLDEVEEWQLLARHYAVAWGCRNEGFEGWESFS